MAKPEFLFSHLTNPRFRDERSPLIFPNAPDDRLGVFRGGRPGGWPEVATRVLPAARDSVVWFPDANVAIKDDTAPVWDAFRLARLGSSRAAVIVSSVVYGELSEWLAEPYRNKDRAACIRSALDTDNSWLERWGLERELGSPVLGAVLGYVRLLAFRRYLAVGGSDGETILGADAASKSKAMDAVKDLISPRAVGLAKKGLRDFEKRGEVNFNDEVHCMTAIVYALRTGRETMILTADEDLLEVFYKAQWFIDTHYRAWLAAKRIKRGEYGEPVREWIDKDRNYFEGPLYLYRRVTAQLQEVLTPFYTTVPVSVIYVSPRGHVRVLGFRFEREMIGMLETRGQTEGRCTDLFGEMNIHADLGPLTHNDHGENKIENSYFGVGRDLGTRVQTDDTFTVLSRLDELHAMNCMEGYA